MGKRKQARPSRPGPGTAILIRDDDEENGEGGLAAGRDEVRRGLVNGTGQRKLANSGEVAEGLVVSDDDETAIVESKVEISVPEFSGDGLEFAEITLLHIVSERNDQGKGKDVEESLPNRAPLRIRLQLPVESKHRIGGYQSLSSEDVTVELLGNSEEDSTQLILSGKIDGPDSAISGFVYLIRHAILVLKARLCTDGQLGSKLGVFVTSKAFESSGLYLENHNRTTLAKAIQKTFAWLRPELSSEAVNTYGRAGSQNNIATISTFEDKHGEFDPTAIYGAVLPSRFTTYYPTICSQFVQSYIRRLAAVSFLIGCMIKSARNEPGLDMIFPELLPELRPYQRRAAYWMVQREQGFGSSHELGSDSSGGASTSDRQTKTGAGSPLWVPVDSSDGLSRFFYNPYSGYVSMEQHDFQTYVHGGILADEMGLGKTVELLACILAHRASKESMLKVMDTAQKVRDRLKKYKRERVECSCGATQEDEFYQGSWVQCDHCDAWQHALCVGYASPIDSDANLRRIAAQAQQVRRDEKLRMGKRAREVFPMPVNIVTKDNPSKRGKFVYGARVKRGTEDTKDNEETFVCGNCAEMIGGVEIEGECGATLVVCPTPILQQWQDEISRHVRAGTLRVMVYKGVQKGATIITGADTSATTNVKIIKAVGAHDLATSDLILTTYDTLRADIHHVASSTHKIQRSFRQPKRYPVIPTPLTKLKWWRVCLDEAQMVESITARATEMAMTLRATHRWCVTGTPIQRGLDDLYGLLRFLGAEPFDDYRWWTAALKQPYEEGKHSAVGALHDLFRGLMWRSTKSQVADELGLPPQEEQLEWLRFSPIEAHFYRQQHERCAVKAREVIAKSRKYNFLLRFPPGKSAGGQRGVEPRAIAKSSSSEASDDVLVPGSITNSCLENRDSEVKGFVDELDDSPLTHNEAEKLLDHLRWLRQACVHPQVGSAGIRTLQRSPMTMDEILEVLVDKAKVEAEDSQRSLIGALNGLAALAIIEKDIQLAVSIYREALAYTEENAHDIRVDPLQKLHTLHNLAEVLGIKLQTEKAADKDHEALVRQTEVGMSDGAQFNGRPDVPRTLRDDLLLKQCQEIKEKYLAGFHAKLAGVQADFRTASMQVQEAQAELPTAGHTWWMEVLSALEQQPDLGNDLIRRIRDQLLESDHLGEAGNMGRVKHRNTSSIALRFRDISGLKIVLVRELGAIEDGRKELLQRLSDLDARMENPDLFDAERAGNCSRCQPDMKGPPCAHCEAEELYQAYENRLFLLKVTATGDEVVSAEDALIAQHVSLALKRRENDTTNLTNNQAPSKGRQHLARNKTSAQVTRSPSETERILTLLRGQVKLVLGRDTISAAKKHLQSLEAMRKEFQQARVLALAQREVLYALHELNMGTSRLRLRFPGEDSESDLRNISILHPEEVPQHNVRLTGEKFMALDELKRAKGQLRYLNGLKSGRQKPQSAGMASSSGSGSVVKTNEAGVEKVEEEECPICNELLGSQFMVLPCGHVLCCKCMLHLVERSTMPQSQKRINCPTCRRRTNVGEIAYVDNAYEKHGFDPTPPQLHGEEKDDNEHAMSVKGSYGTKLEAVLRRILWLKAKNPETRILLFSEWQGVLDVVEHALIANHITFARVKGGGKLNAAIEKFRGIESTTSLRNRRNGKATMEKAQGHVQVLLMPIKLGANGLNLVEAQHVMLLEPLLNPAAEAQAINRVHRIGQTHATFVHRFVVHDTVEESIYELRRHKGASLPGLGTGKPDVYGLTLRDLSSLFKIHTGGSNVSAQLQASALVGSLGDLPPAKAAAAAAEARLILSRASHEK